MIREDKERMASLGESTRQSDKPPEKKIFEFFPKIYLGKLVKGLQTPWGGNISDNLF